MARVVFPIGLQKNWINKIVEKNNLDVIQIAKICKVNPRTIRDWRREKFTIPKKIVDLLANKFSIKPPNNLKLVDDYWYAIKNCKKGALRKLELYGPPGTPEGRIKGGHISQLLRKQNPEKYKNCNLRKGYVWPSESNNLAELMGILLGDGGISHDQVKITLNWFVEKEYVEYVCCLVKKLFCEAPKILFYKNPHVKVCNVTLSGIAVVEFLIKVGLGRGNKVKRQVRVPNWVTKNLEYSKETLKGLVDTDGGIFYHKHKNNNGKDYYNVGLTFTNRSKPLLDFVWKTLTKLGFHAKLAGDGVYLYRIGEVLKYEQVVKFSNSHHTQRLKDFLEKKNIGGV